MEIAHYTTGNHLMAILEAGYLKTTPSPENLINNERPMVWFSDNLKRFPPTALKPLRAAGHEYHPNESELHAVCGLFRFVADSADIGAVTWRVAQKKARISNRMAKPLLMIAQQKGESPGEWWCSLERVHLDNLRFQIRTDDGQWADGDLDIEALMAARELAGIQSEKY